MGRNWSVVKLAVRVINTPELSIAVQLGGNLTTHLNWAGCQRVVQRVQLYILIMLSFLLFQNCNLSKLFNQHWVITSRMFCRLQYRLFWNLWFLFYILYFCLLRQSIVLLCAQISVRCLDHPRCKTKNHRRSVDAHFQDVAGHVPHWFLPLKAANTLFMDGCNQSPLR